MNFFQHQDQARRNTRWLMLLFSAAVFCLIVITNLFLLLFPWGMNTRSLSNESDNPMLACLMTAECDFWASMDWQRLFWVSVSVIVVIGGVSLYKWISIAAGGKRIAEMMGGSMIKANTTDADEKRLLNVVEEMALAANMPVPAVYVLSHEMGLNAFAAGFSTRDAVVAVTQGTLNSMNRDQLQGIVAHEFSHILNGDMRLNMHLIAILHGIVFIGEAGFALLRGGSYSHRDSKSGPVMLLALGLIVIGAIGTLFASLIKAAVSRQREFLADASAVQFTRNPQGISGALKIIGGSHHGSHVNDAHGAEISHLFFSEGMSWSQAFFATHPPLDDRIRRIEPHWDGAYALPEVRVKTTPAQQAEAQQQAAEQRQADKTQKKAQFGQAVAAGIAVSAGVKDEKPDLDQPIEFESVLSVDATLHQPLGAAAALCHLLLPVDEGALNEQLKQIKTSWPELHRVLERSDWQGKQREDFLPVVELAVSGLRLMSEEEYRRFKQLLIRLIQLDGKVDLYEWSLYYLLRGTLDAHFNQAIRPKPKYKDIKSLEDDMIAVLALLVSETAQHDDDKLRAFQRACNTCGIYNAPATLPAADMPAFTRAIKKLSNAYPMVKGRFIKAMVDAAKVDGTIELVEKHTIVSVAAVIDSPLTDVMLQQLEA